MSDVVSRLITALAISPTLSVVAEATTLYGSRRSRRGNQGHAGRTLSKKNGLSVSEALTTYRRRKSSGPNECIDFLRIPARHLYRKGARVIPPAVHERKVVPNKNRV
jgi:hypothetical protein